MEMVNVKAMPGTQFWFIRGKNKKHLGSQMGQTDKKTF